MGLTELFKNACNFLALVVSSKKPIVRQIEELVDKILTAKKQDKNADTTQWEREIARVVHR